MLNFSISSNNHSLELMPNRNWFCVVHQVDYDCSYSLSYYTYLIVHRNEQIWMVLWRKHIHHGWYSYVMDENYDGFGKDWDFQWNWNWHYSRKINHWKKRTMAMYVDCSIDLTMKEKLHYRMFSIRREKSETSFKSKDIIFCLLQWDN